MKRVVLSSLVLAGSLHLVRSQDYMLLHNGTEMQCKILEIGSQQIKYRKSSAASTASQEIPISQVFMVKFKNGVKRVWDTPAEENKEETKLEAVTKSSEKKEVSEPLLTSKPISLKESDLTRLSETTLGNQCLIYVVRPTNYGFLIPIPVSCNKEEIGSTKGKQFIAILANPGKHTLVTTAENTDELEIWTEPGKIYYVEQRIKMGLVMARCKMELLDPSLGKEKLAKCKLAVK